MYMKLLGSEDAVHYGDKERRNDDHALTGGCRERRDPCKNRGNVTSLPSSEQVNGKSICIAAHNSLLVLELCRFSLEEINRETV